MRRLMLVELSGELLLVCYMPLALLAFCSNCVAAALRESPEATVLPTTAAEVDSLLRNKNALAPDRRGAS